MILLCTLMTLRCFTILIQYLKQIDSELDNTNCWLAFNKLSLNISKTKYMIFHTNYKEVVCPDLKISNTVY